MFTTLLVFFYLMLGSCTGLGVRRHTNRLFAVHPSHWILIFQSSHRILILYPVKRLPISRLINYFEFSMLYNIQYASWVSTQRNLLILIHSDVLTSLLLQVASCRCLLTLGTVWVNSISSTNRTKNLINVYSWYQCIYKTLTNLTERHV